MVQQARTLLEGTFVDRRRTCWCSGAGVGKTHLLVRWLRNWCEAADGYFAQCSLLVQELLQAKQELRLPALLKRLARYEVLIVDDLGYVQQNREEMEVLFTLLAERYERGSVLLTSNLPFSKWEEIFETR